MRKWMTSLLSILALAIISTGCGGSDGSTSLDGTSTETPASSELTSASIDSPTTLSSFPAIPQLPVE